MAREQNTTLIDEKLRQLGYNFTEEELSKSSSFPDNLKSNPNSKPFAIINESGIN